MTPKQEAFCREYVVDFNGQKAAERAGYAPKSARVTASRLLTNVNIAAKVAELVEARAQETGITAAKVVERIGDIAFANPLDYLVIGEDGLARIDLSTVDERKARAIKEVTSEAIGDAPVMRNKLKLNDPLRALELLGRHTGAFNSDRHPGDDLPGEVVVRIIQEGEESKR